jgi:hypothetical protein
MENLSELARKLKNEYQKQWRRNNPKKNYQYGLNYWERKALKLGISENPEPVTLNPKPVTLNPEPVTLNPIMNEYSGLPRCENCGQPFSALRMDAKLCSPACRQAYRRKKSKSTTADLIS